MLTGSMKDLRSGVFVSGTSTTNDCSVSRCEDARRAAILCERADPSLRELESRRIDGNNRLVRIRIEGETGLGIFGTGGGGSNSAG